MPGNLNSPQAVAARIRASLALFSADAVRDILFLIGFCKYCGEDVFTTNGDRFICHCDENDIE